MNTTRAGVKTSPQIAVFGVITNLATANFKLADKDGQPAGFLIKNDSGAEVTLSIKTMLNAAFVETLIAPGWNFELCVEILQNATATNLKWGY